MKRISKLFTVCCFVIVSTTHAQDQLDCDFNFREALFYLKGDANFEKDTLKSVEFLTPCLDLEHANSQMLMGKIYASRKGEANYKEAFKLFKKSAKQGNSIAAADLGVLFKYGRGTRLNFNKARKWFKKGAELGNDKAAYSLGYLYYKGFGNIDQNYSKAVKWFKKSDHPMAKYWLGVSYYYGYGVTKDISKANELLGTTLADDTSNNSNNSTNTSATNIPQDFELNYEDSIADQEFSENNLLGSWKGLLLKYDWSGNNVEQKIPLIIEFKNDSITGSTVYNINIENQEFLGTVNTIENTIYFEDVRFKLPYVSFDARIPNELNYEFLSSDLNLKDLDGSNYLTGSLDSFIPSWNESGAPIKFVLKKKETYANTDEEISDEILQALAGQEENFIQLYPNPFQSDLIISYTLDAPSFVEVRITDINGNNSSVIEQGKNQKQGKHRYYFDGTNLKNGVYVVSVIANNQRKTRIIIKN